MRDGSWLSVGRGRSMDNRDDAASPLVAKTYVCVCVHHRVVGGKMAERVRGGRQ